jgi:hypothetical protein
VSAPVRLTGSLPDGYHDNGLDALAGRFVQRPHDTTWAIVRFTTKRLTTDLDDGQVVPTIRIESVEPVIDETAVAELERIADLARERRVGGKQLPLPDRPDDDGEDGDGDDL